MHWIWTGHQIKCIHRTTGIITNAKMNKKDVEVPDEAWWDVNCFVILATELAFSIPHSILNYGSYISIWVDVSYSCLPLSFPQWSTPSSSNSRTISTMGRMVLKVMNMWSEGGWVSVWSSAKTTESICCNVMRHSGDSIGYVIFYWFCCFCVKILSNTITIWWNDPIMLEYSCDICYLLFILRSE